MGVGHTELVRDKGRRRLALVMLVVVLLLAIVVLVLAMATGFPYEEVLWMYIESTQPTVLAA